MIEHAYTDFGTRWDYVDQLEPAAFDDREYRDEWQDRVYREAQSIFMRNGYRTVADFGCGSAFKLVKYFPPGVTIGIEIDPALSFVKNKYPIRQWRDGKDIVAALRDAEMIISSDVIEHLSDPAQLLSAFVNSAAELFVISTPALELLAERSISPRLGPPANKSHIREWTTGEFYNFVSKYLDIIDHQITNIGQCTQMVVARKR